MATGLLLLLDDIATVLDDVSVLTKVAVKKTAGVLGDDLALNAQQVLGIEPNRELPVVWAVAKGSLINKVILVPSALLLGAAAPWAIEVMMIIGGTYLCFEGCEKIAHKWLHPADEAKHRHEHEAAVADPAVDLVALEKSKIAGAIRTDFILSAEIIVITLGTLASSPFMMQLAVLVAVALLMTVGVYGLVAGIVKLDDVGMHLIKTPAESSLANTRKQLGRVILASAPYLMKFLSIAGTAAMFLVGGGILVHGIPVLHHWAESLLHRIEAIEPLGHWLAWGSGMLINAVVGMAAGAVTLLVVNLVKRLYRKAG
jgi:uncharacterized protein